MSESTQTQEIVTLKNAENRSEESNADMTERKKDSPGTEKWLEESGISFKLIRSRRKSLAIQLQRDGTVVARAPLRMSESSIRMFIREKKPWISLHKEKQQMRNEREQLFSGATEEELRAYRKQAADQFAERTAFFAGTIGVNYGRITIRDQKTRWGSCSRAGNLNYNFRLILAPPEVLDYVVVHELCHRKQMNHSALFWQEVEKVLPDYQKPRRWLWTEGWRLMG